MQKLKAKPVLTSEEAVRDFFWNKYNQDTTHPAEPFTLKVMLLSYFAYAWCLVFTENEQALFPGPIRADDLGPVSPKQWNTDYSDVPPTIDELNLHPETNEFLNWIFETYGDMSVYELIATTRAEDVYVDCHEAIDALTAELRAENVDSSLINKLPVIDDDKIYAQYLAAMSYMRELE